MLTLLNCNNNVALRCGISLFCGALSSAKAQGEIEAEGIDLLYGHYELQMDYTAEEGFQIGVSYNLSNNFNGDDTTRRLPAETSRIVVPPKAKRTLTQGVSFIGEPAEPGMPDKPLWLLTQAFEVGNHFLGMRVIAAPNLFQTNVSGNFLARPPGSIGLRLLSVTGSGPDRGGSFALWETGGLAGVNVHFNSNDGIDEDDDLPFLPIGAHSHFFWGFTQPGSYEVEFETYGRLVNGTDVAGSEVITFIVPHDGVVTEFEGQVCREGERWELAVGDATAGVVYGERRVFLQAETEDGDRNWTCPFELAAEGWTLPDVAGLPVALAGNGAGDDFAGGVRLCLVEHVGPGSVKANSTGGAVAFDSSDGLDGSDCIALTSGPATGTLSFTEEGLHWLCFRAEGLAGGAVAASSGELWLRCGANLEADYDYAAWADSFERAAGLAAGTLSDPAADFDNDGFSNRLEYFQEAAGASPVTSDCPGRVTLEADSSHGRLIFMRDLYKDALDNGPLQLIAGASEDLLTWNEVSPLNVGFPLVEEEDFDVDGIERRDFIFETGQEEGNARSLFMMRALRSPRPDGGQDFFRLRSEINAN